MTSDTGSVWHRLETWHHCRGVPPCAPLVAQPGAPTIPCVTVEGLILLKLYALPSLYSQGNFSRVGLYENDVATLIHAYRPQLDSLLEELSQHLSEGDLAQVKQIVAEAQDRIERFADSPRNSVKK